MTFTLYFYNKRIYTVLTILRIQIYFTFTIILCIYFNKMFIGKCMFIPTYYNIYIIICTYLCDSL